jgi:hypothetical protein
MNGQNKLMKNRMTLMIDVMSPLLSTFMSSIEILNCMTLLLIHCSNQ